MKSFKKNGLFLFFFLLSLTHTLHTQVQQPNNFGIPFNVSMERNRTYKPFFAENDLFWKCAKEQYDKYVIGHPPYQEEARIPKIIHHIWLGSPLPEKYRQLRETWKQHHPDWEFYLWTDTDVESLGLVNKKVYDATKNYGEKSDIARYEILYRFGGLYVDTDFECLKAFDYLHHCYDFFIGISYNRITPGYVRCYNGLIGAAKGHPILKDAVEKMQRKPGAGDKYLDIINRTGPEFLSHIIQKKLARDPGYMILFPMTYFYPAPIAAYYGQKHLTIPFMKSKICPESLAIHYWDQNWITPNMIRR